MRPRFVLRLVGSMLLLVAGAWLALLAPVYVRSPAIERFGEAMHWPGAYALTTNGCFFLPDHDRWAARFAVAGWSIVLLAFGLAASSFRHHAAAGEGKPVAGPELDDEGFDA